MIKSQEMPREKQYLWRKTSGKVCDVCGSPRSSTVFVSVSGREGGTSADTCDNPECKASGQELAEELLDMMLEAESAHLG